MGHVTISINRFAPGCRPPDDGGEEEPQVDVVEGKYGPMWVSHGSCPAVNAQIAEFHGVTMRIDGEEVSLLATDSADAISQLHPNPFNNREAITRLVDYLVSGP